MATKQPGWLYRTGYRMLLRLYPRAFRERFRESIAQTFDDVCREQRDSGRGPGALVLWMVFETSMAIVRENVRHMSYLRSTMLRVGLASLALTMVPLVASQVVDGWNWPARAFALVYVLFFGTGMLYAAVARKMGAWSYKAGVGVALASAFALGWSNMVHVADSENPANLMYFGVLGVGIAGACLARLEARGLARTLFAMAATLALIAAALPSGAPPDFARTMAIWHVVLVALFTASGLLFRHASWAAAGAQRA